MSAGRLAFIAGTVIQVSGFFMGSTVLVAWIYHETDDIPGLVVASIITVLAGWIIRRSVGVQAELLRREAFAAVALAWLAAIAFGTLPYLLTGAIASTTDAVFESASGFTATGSTIIDDPASLTHGVLFWRSLTQWLGGMGIVILIVGFLSRLGVAGHWLAEAEAPGPSAERFTPKFRDTARTLWLLFTGFTAAQTLLLMLNGMTLFDGLCHSFTTLAGGGFGTDARSMAAFSPGAQWVVVLFMIVGGTSFALHHRGLFHPIEYVRNAEFRLYLQVVAAGSAFVIIGTWGGPIHDTIRDGVFTVASIITTTGFVTADYALWSAPLHILVIGLMFMGAMSGSTSGSVKVRRVEVMARTIRGRVRNLVHPDSIHVVSIDGHHVDNQAAGAIVGFFLLYILTFLVGTISLSLITTLGGGEDLGLVTSASAVATTLGNIGPGLDAVGPTTTFAVIPTVGKWLLSAIMVIGRLEIIPVVMLFSREAWRR